MSKTKFTIIEVLDTLGEKKLDRDDYKLLYENFETQIDKKGYLQFKLTEKDKWKSVHTLVNQYFNSEEHNKKYEELVETGIEKWLVTHHINFFEKENKLNNHPDNLQWMGSKEHLVLHQTVMYEVIDRIWNPENPEYCNFEKQRENIRLATSKNMKKMLKENWYGENNEEYREKMKLISSKIQNELWYGENNEEYREKIKPFQIASGTKVMNELWYGENSEEFRIKMKLIHSENNYKLWHGENSEEFRIKMKPIQSENATKVLNELWHGENNKEYREKIRPTQVENGKKVLLNLWYGENNKDYREKQSEAHSKISKELWYGENNEIYREKMKPIQSDNATKMWTEFWERPNNKNRRKEQSEKIKKITQDYWYGENNEENRKNHAERLIERNSDPKHKQKSLEGKIFKIFKKILEAGEKITNETFIKYKFNGAPYPITVFGSLENAIEKLKDYNPKRY